MCNGCRGKRRHTTRRERPQRWRWWRRRRRHDRWRRRRFDWTCTDQRLHAHPASLHLRAELEGKPDFALGNLENKGTESITIGGVVPVPQEVDGVQRPNGDFKIDGVPRGLAVAPGASAPPVAVTFHPQVHHETDLAQPTRRATRAVIVDMDAHELAVLHLHGTALPPDDESRTKHDNAATMGAVEDHGTPSAPRTFAEMRRYVGLAATQLDDDHYDRAIAILRTVQHELYARAPLDKVEKALRASGAADVDAERAGRDADDSLQAVNDMINVAIAGGTIATEGYVTTFEGGEQAIRFTLGEIPAAPHYKSRDNPVGDALSTAAGALDPRNQVKGLEWLYDNEKQQLDRDPVVSAGKDVLSDFGNLDYDKGLIVGFTEGGERAVQELVEAGKAVGEALATAIQSPGLLVAKYLPKAMRAAKAFAAFLGDPKASIQKLGAVLAGLWNNPDDFSRGEFRGEVVGYLMTQVAIAVITEGIAAEAQLAVKATGFFKEFLSLFEESGALAEDGLSFARSAAGTTSTSGTMGAGRAGDAAANIADTASVSTDVGSQAATADGNPSVDAEVSAASSAEESTERLVQSIGGLPRDVIEQLLARSRALGIDSERLVEMYEHIRGPGMRQLLSASDDEFRAAAEAARLESEASGSHSLSRHGPQNTDDELRRRVETGEAPDGNTSPTRNSTRFLSYEDWLQTRQAVIDDFERTFGIRLDQPLPNGDTEAQIVFEHGRQIGEGWRGRTGTGTGGNRWAAQDPINGASLTRTKTTMNWNGTRWEMAQHFPFSATPTTWVTE